MVCMGGEATAQTGECGLRPAVAFIDIATSGAGTTCVPWVYETARDTCALGFVDNKVRQLPEAPTLVLVALTLSYRRPVANARQIFQGQSGFRVLSTRNKGFRNAVVDPTAKA